LEEKPWKRNLGSADMGQAAKNIEAETDMPAPASTETVLDLEHLARMTFGEAKLEREVLSLFDRQADLLLSRMRDAAPAVVAAYAHTLKGSACGVGAWRVAEAAGAVEMSAAAPDDGGASNSVTRLSVAVDETEALIAEILKPYPAHGTRTFKACGRR
jgi:HPt (histidine-containing phosphotransfer) domain-containing protein